MTITYPLSLPDTISFRSVSLEMTNRVAMTESVFTGTQQVFQHSGAMWRASIELVPMDRASAAPWQGFLAALNGRAGSFLMGPDPLATLRGSAAGTPLAAGAQSENASTLDIDGLTASATDVFRDGDFIQIGSGTSARLYMVLGDHDADGGGAATLDIWPSLRVAVADNAAIVSSSPVGLFRLSSNAIAWSAAELSYGLTFDAVSVS